MKSPRIHSAPSTLGTGNAVWKGWKKNSTKTTKDILSVNQKPIPAVDLHSVFPTYCLAFLEMSHIR